MRRTSVSLCCAALLSALGGVQLAQAAGSDDSPAPDPRIRRGFAIVPHGVHLNMEGRDRAQVGLGSYLVNAVGGCNDCHTHPSYLPGGDPFQGQPALINADQYLTGGRQFGPITSANLRPDANGLPAGLKLWEFIRTIRSGHNPHDPPGQILQVMPWPVYSHMVEGDLRAIYAFLSALPSAPDNPAPGP
jgi:hypothetical protein